MQILGQARFRRACGSLLDRKSTRLNSSHSQISYAVFCLKKKNDRHASSRGHLSPTAADIRCHLLFTHDNAESLPHHTSILIARLSYIPTRSPSSACSDM